MAKNKKSKILAMALCASVMTGIYASPVMAAELWQNNAGTVVTERDNRNNKDIKITELEGLEEIKVGQADGNDDGLVKITGKDGEGLVRVGDSHGQNVRLAKDGVYINTNGDDKRTGLTAGTLTLAGNALTSVQLANINSVIGENGVINAANGSTVGGVTMNDGRVSGTGFFVRGSDYALGTTGLRLGEESLDESRLATINDVITKDGAVESKGDVTSKAADGTTYTLNTVGNNTSGIASHYNGQVTTIEGAFSVNENGYIYNANGSFQVTGDGVARFGKEAGPNVRIENGDVTSTYYDKDGNKGSYSLNTIGANTAGIERIQNSAGNNITEIEDTLRIYDNGTISTVNGAFRINEQGNVFANAVNVADGAVVISENSINAFGNQFTVNKNGKLSTTGINVAEGMFTASAGGVTMANNNLSVDLNGNITAGTYNGVKIGMNEDGDIILGDGTVIDDNFNSDNVAGITRKPLDDSAPGSGNTTFIEQNTAISADGIVVTDPENLVSTKTKYDGFYVKDKDGNNVSSLTKDKLNLAGENLAYKDSEGNINVTADTYTAGDVAGENVRVKADGIYVKDGGAIVSSLKDDGLMLTDQESGKQTLNATDIADIKGIDRSGNKTDGYTTTIEGATSFTKDGMVTSNITTDSFTAGVTEDSIYHINAKGEMLFRSGDNYIGMNRDGIGLMSGTESVTINGDGTTFKGVDSDGKTSSTTIKGGTITTDTIVLRDSMTDEDGNSIALGADGTLKVNNENYSLNLDETGFNLSNASNSSSFSLGEYGFTFSGPVNLGAGDKVGFTHTGSGKYITLDGLVDRVEDLEQKTTGISFDEKTGNTTIKDMNKGTDDKWTAGDSSVTVGDNGTTFENGEGNGTTNINGGAIDADSSSIGNDVSGGSGSGSSGMTGDGTYTDGSKHSGHFVDEDSSYEFTNDANGFTGTVTDGKNTTTIENGVKGSNTTVKGDNASASSGVGIGNDGAFISDSVTNGDISHTVNGGSITDTVTNGDMTVTEVKDENGSATTVKDADGSSTVSQNTNGQTVSTGTGISVNTGNDFSVTDNETGKSIYMSDIGHVEDIDSEIQNSDGSKTTVVDAVNNEAEIRRNEIERVDGRINNLENRVGELEDRIDKVGAMAAAIANLRTMGYDPAAPTEVAVGIGQYRDETGAALGLFHYPNRDFMLSLSVSTSGDEVMGGIGATWKFGRKSPEKVAEIKKAQAEADARRAEEAKLAKAEEMKQAAKEAKIKAQQERHAKLAAERAAQAEAAK